MAVAVQVELRRYHFRKVLDLGAQEPDVNRSAQSVESSGAERMEGQRLLRCAARVTGESCDRACVDRMD